MTITSTTKTAVIIVIDVTILHVVEDDGSTPNITDDTL
jgi:hypothetical protein